MNTIEHGMASVLDDESSMERKRMLFKDAMRAAQRALQSMDREQFIVSVHIAQAMADGDREMVALLDAAVQEFPDSQALDIALELAQMDANPRPSDGPQR
jgi:hypothetical protein